MKTYSIILLSGMALMASTAKAGTWGNWIAGGDSCNNGNVMVVDNGSQLSVLFTSFGVNMPQGAYGDGNSARKTCTFRVQLTPPSGYYLARFTQLYSGGLIKSRNSSARLQIRYNVGPVAGAPLPIVWNAGQAITPEDPASSFTRTYNNNLLVANCGGSTVYGLNMQFFGTRNNAYSDYLVGGLDSVDADFQQRIILIPEWQLCRR